jgi:hypothetical protein
LMDTMTQCFKLDQYRDYTDHDAKIDTYSWTQKFTEKSQIF